MFLLIHLFTDSFPVFSFYNPWKDFLSFPGGIKGNTGKKSCTWSYTFVDSCSLTAFFKKEKRTLAAYHLMRTNFLTFFKFTELSEDLNTLNASDPDAHLIFKNSASILPLRAWFPICVLLISDICVAVGHAVFVNVTTVVNTQQLTFLVSRTKHSKYTFVTLLKHFFTTKLDWWHFCIKLLRLPSDVRVVTTNLPFLTS